MTADDPVQGACKSRLRREALRRRRNLDANTRAALSATIQRHFLRSRLFLSSHALGCYIAMRDEVDTSLILERTWRAGKNLYVPITGADGSMAFAQLDRSSKLIRNRFGLWEPVDGPITSPSRLDVVVTPLAAFDPARNRIGMGGGYFDRHFARLAHRHQWLHPKLVGIAFACQRVDAIETDEWDVPLYRIFDEDGIH